MKKITADSERPENIKRDGFMLQVYFPFLHQTYKTSLGKTSKAKRTGED